MTFRHPLAYRWMFPVLMAPLAAVLVWSAGFTGFRRFRYDPVALGGAAALIALLALAFQSWRVWTTRVTVGDRIEWKRGAE